MSRIWFVVLLLAVAVADAQVSSSSRRKLTIGKPPEETTTSTQEPNSATKPPAPAPLKLPLHVGPDIKATDAERAAVTFTGYDLDIRLVPAQQSIAVRALLKVRNDGDQALLHLPLQVSSSLEWEAIRITGKEAPYALQTIDSDADHTGQLREAVVVLPQPLLPGQQTALDVVYRGTVKLGSKRLQAIGMPSDVALRSDWDRISPSFTGLRGFGNVAWYPISSAPVALGDGAKLFTETGRQKQRQSPAVIQMEVSVEYLGTAPNLALLNGSLVPVVSSTELRNEAGSEAAEEVAGAEIPLIAKCRLAPQPLGFASPSLVIASRIDQADLRPGSTAHSINAFLRPGDESTIDTYLNATAKVAPLLEQWLGPVQKLPLTLVDLPEPNDAPFESGSALLTSLQAAAPEDATLVMAHALAHSCFRSSREWLNEGVAYFIGTLWIEKSLGREAALKSLESSPLALAEPPSPTVGEGQDLIHASDPVYYRSKAAYVFWMLRDLVGDEQLGMALRDYDPAADTTQEYFEHLLERSPVDGTAKKNLKWFFEDWVYRDPGLPDLSIQSVYPTKSAAAGSYVVAINLTNEGYAAAEVPVTLRSAVTSLTERVLIPSRSKLSHRMLIQGAPLEVTLNDHVVPEMQASRHALIVDKPGDKPDDKP